jgi:hypothetical protein
VKVANIIFVSLAFASWALRLDAAGAVGVAPAPAPGNSTHGQPGAPTLISNQQFSTNPSDHKWREAKLKAQQAAEAEKASQELSEKLTATKGKAPLLWQKTQSKLKNRDAKLVNGIDGLEAQPRPVKSRIEGQAARFKAMADSVLSPSLLRLVNSAIPSREELDAAIAEVKVARSYIRKLAKASRKAADALDGDGSTPGRRPENGVPNAKKGLTEHIKDEVPPIDSISKEEAAGLAAQAAHFDFKSAAAELAKEMGGATTSPPVEHLEEGDEL